MNAIFIVLALLLILFNAFFVIAEYALVRSRRTRLEALADEGARGARLAMTQIDETTTEFKLNPAAKFSNGDAVTSTDVAFSIETILSQSRAVTFIVISERSFPLGLTS